MLIPVTLRPSRRQLRTFGLITAVLTAVVGASFYFRGHMWGISVEPALGSQLGHILWGASVALVVAAFAVPKAFVPLYVLLTVVTLPIGFVMSHILIATIYFVIITPIALVMRVLGRDTMTRKLDRAAPTYWVKRSETKPGRYLRQY
jgi:hypothetical protein